jgi:hypothetical protein
MTTLEQIEEGLSALSSEDKQALFEKLANLLEDELEMTDEFKAEIEQAKTDIAAGRFRVVKP